MPIMPFVALITAEGIIKIRKQIVAKGLIAVSIVGALIQYYAVSFGIAVLPDTIKTPFFLPREIAGSRIELTLFDQQLPIPSKYFSHPVVQDWDSVSKKILTVIEPATKDKNPRKITFLNDIAELWALLQYQSFLGNFPLTIYCDSLFLYGWNRVPLDEYILKTDYLFIEKNPAFKPSTERLEKEAINLFFKRYQHNFSLLQKIELPSRRTLLIYKRKDELEKP
jgi:hypothetical protein